MNDTPMLKKALKWSLMGALIASLCCLSPLILFLIGLATASLAGSLANTFYYQYKWYFRLAGLVFLIGAFLVWYYQRTKTCSLDEKRRLRRKLLNLFLLSLVVFILVYVVWLYGVVEFLGIKLGLWHLPKGVNLKQLL